MKNSDEREKWRVRDEKLMNFAEIQIQKSRSKGKGIAGAGGVEREVNTILFPSETEIETEGGGDIDRYRDRDRGNDIDLDESFSTTTTDADADDDAYASASDRDYTYTLTSRDPLGKALFHSPNYANTTTNNNCSISSGVNSISISEPAYDYNENSIQDLTENSIQDLTADSENSILVGRCGRGDIGHRFDITGCSPLDLHLDLDLDPNPNGSPYQSHSQVDIGERVERVGIRVLEAKDLAEGEVLGGLNPYVQLHWGTLGCGQTHVYSGT